LGGILPQKQQLAWTIPWGSAGMHGFVDPGAVRGAEHRRRRRKMPAGARTRCARVGWQYTDVLPDDPAGAEKHRYAPPRMMRGGAPRPAP